MNTTANVNGRVLNAPNTVQPAGLSECHTLRDKIRYACEQLRPDPTTATVRDWLAQHGVTTHRPYVSTTVNAWRRERGLADTGELPALPAELSAQLDTEHEHVQDGRADADRTPNGRVPNASADHPAAPDNDGFSPDRRTEHGARGYYLVAAMTLLVSIDTSWRFFEHNLHITAIWERVVMFSVIEMALIACGSGMRASVIRNGHPGPARFIAWLLCGLSGYMAWQLSGVAEGLARVALGPALGLVMLHLALGIEIRAGTHRTTTWARVGRELRERALSRLGLADDERDALARTRDRAARRVARLSLATMVLLRSSRLARALRASNVAHDLDARARMLDELAVLRHADELATLHQPSPWRSSGGTT